MFDVRPQVDGVRTAAGARGLMASRTRKAANVNVEELRRAKYLDARRLGDSAYVVTPAILRAPFPQGSAALRAAADKALAAELADSVERDKSQ